MIELKNAFTGTQMWVADDRKEEYLAAGHVLAVTPPEVKPTKAAKVEGPKAEKPVKKTIKKR